MRAAQDQPRSSGVVLNQLESIRSHRTYVPTRFGWMHVETRSPARIPRPRGVSRSEWESHVHSNRVRTYVRSEVKRLAPRADASVCDCGASVVLEGLVRHLPAASIEEEIDLDTSMADRCRTHAVLHRSKRSAKAPGVALIERAAPPASWIRCVVQGLVAGKVVRGPAFGAVESDDSARLRAGRPAANDRDPDAARALYQACAAARSIGRFGRRRDRSDSCDEDDDGYECFVYRLAPWRWNSGICHGSPPHGRLACLRARPIVKARLV